MTTVDRYPSIEELKREDENPAIQLFGRRFYKDQTEYEYLIEFLMLFISEKQIGDTEISGYDSDDWKGFPEINDLQSLAQSGDALNYYPPLRLALKLFAFLGSSNIETRHPCHIKRYNFVFDELKKRIQSIIPEKRVLEIIEQVLIGFEGIAQNRTWCTLVFLPMATKLIAGEAIWKRMEGKKHPDISWETDVFRTTKFFTFSNHDFMARGGEVLYLQLCNLFSKINTQDVTDFEKQMNHPTGTVLELKAQIESGLKNHFKAPPSLALNALVDWIESADPWTKEEIEGPETKRKSTCGWCPQESWPEAYLFAYELANICNAAIDPIEKIEMLKYCCVFQVLRSLCAQSARYWDTLKNDGSGQYGGICDFAWLVTSPDLKDQALKNTAARNLSRIQEMIHGALRNEKIDPKDGSYRLGDEQGQELFVKLGKKLGFIVPWKGPNARMVFNDELVRFFALALIKPGQRMTYTSFQDLLFRHYGIAVGDQWLKKAIRWTYPTQDVKIHSTDRDWLEEKLRITGFLIPLSDSFSLVRNQFDHSEDTQ